MSDATSEKNPNPQGKGLVPVLQDLAHYPATPASPRTPLGFFKDYCLSSLVLSADFRFKPVPLKPYYLFSTSSGWNLSLVSPDEWQGRAPGTFVARCELRRDMTWEVDFATEDPGVDALEKIEQHFAAFVESLTGDEDIASTLPYFVAALPYYQRVLATGLAKTLESSMPGEHALAKALANTSRATLLQDLGSAKSAAR